MRKWILGAVVGLVLGTALSLGAQSGPYTAQIQRALAAFRTAPQTFTGTTTFTAPALFPDGTSALPGIAYASEPALGFYRPQATQIYVSSGRALGIGAFGAGAVYLFGSAGGGTVEVANLGRFVWANGSNEQGALDTGISRSAAAVVALGSGVQGDASGTGAMTKLQLTATVFANLGTNLTVNGQEIFCSDCTETTPATCPTTQASCVCAGSGTGAFARRINGVSYCTF